MPSPTRSRVFWSGGSQAVRVPKSMRFDSDEVTIEQRGNGLLIVPVVATDDWAGFWDTLKSLSRPVKRAKTRRAEKRERL